MKTKIHYSDLPKAEEPKEGSLDAVKGILKSVIIGTVLWLIIILFLCSCSPYQRVSEPVRMQYSVDGVL